MKRFDNTPPPVRIGERRMEIASFGGDRDAEAFPCTVISINVPHRFYRVQFLETGLRESYKY